MGMAFQGEKVSAFISPGQETRSSAGLCGVPAEPVFMLCRKKKYKCFRMQADPSLPFMLTQRPLMASRGEANLEIQYAKGPQSTPRDLN